MACDIKTFDTKINYQFVKNIVEESKIVDESGKSKYDFNTFIEKIKSDLFQTSLFAITEDLANENEDFYTSVEELISSLQTEYKNITHEDLSEELLATINETVLEIVNNQPVEYSPSYEEELNRIFSPDLKVANENRKSDFRRRFSMQCIMDTRKSVNGTNHKPSIISSNSVELNNAITSLLQEEFNTLYEFILTTDYALKRKPVFSSTSNDGVATINKNYVTVLKIMLEYIASKISNESTHEGSFYSDLYDSYKNYIFGLSKKDTLLYRAVNAYLTLSHIDDILKDTFGKNIKIEDQMFPNMIIIDNENNKSIKSKYSFNTNGNNQATHWGIEDHDSIKEMGSWSKSLIESIPIKNHKGGEDSVIFGYLTPKDFLLAMTTMILAGLRLKSLSTKDNNSTQFQTYAVEVVSKPQLIEEMLKLLFNNTKNKTLLLNLGDFNLNDNYLNILYSFYETVIKGTKEHYSWLEVENKSISLDSFKSLFPIVNSLYNVAIANVKMQYTLTTYNYDSGRTETKIKNSINNRTNIFNRCFAINNSNILLRNKSTALSLYSITRNQESFTDDKVSDYQYNVKISDSISFVINATKSKTNGLLTHTQDSEREFGVIISKNNVQDVDLLETLSKYEIVSEHDMYLFIRNGIDNEDAHTLHTILSFVDSMLQTNFLFNCSNFKEYTLYMLLSGRNRSTALRNLIVCASRALLINDIYSLFNAATKENGTPYAKYELPLFFINNPKVYPEINLGNVNSLKTDSFYQNTRFGRQLQVVNTNATWLQVLANAHSIVTGEANNSTISFLNGSRYPNYSPYFAGLDAYRMFTFELDPEAGELSASQYLLFSKGLPEIVSTSIDAEVNTNNTIKAVKDMNDTELISDKIINKFFGSMCDTGTMFVQPTVYADKHKPLLYQVMLSRINLSGNISLIDAFKLLSWNVMPSTDDFNNSNTLSNLVVNKLHSTVGRHYRTAYNNVISDYLQLWQVINNGQEFTIKNLYTWLGAQTEQGLMAYVDLYNNQNTNKITFYKDVHYRKLKNGSLAFNELLDYYANVLYNEYRNGALISRLKKEQVNFANSLIEKNIGLRILYLSNGHISDTDTISRYMKNSKFSGTENTKLWLDKNGSTIIIGKIINTETGNITNVTYKSFTLAENERFVLNPALNNYFMSDILLSTNLRLLSTGSEIAHKPAILSSKGNVRTDVINALRSINMDKKSINTLIGNKETINLQDLEDIIHGIGENIFYNLEMLSAGQEMDENHAIIPLTNERIILINQEITYNNLILNTLNNVESQALTAFESSGLIALIKRNVAATATINPFLQNTLQGVGQKINIAAVDDILGSVYNFSGESDNIDACDGMALESPLQHYLENNSLGENGTGYVKKPIHTWYNPKYGSATLLKYAINVITNQTMRMSEGNNIFEKSNGISLYNLFQKMHNMRWHNDKWNGLYSETDNWNNFGKIDLINGCDFIAPSLLSNQSRIKFSSHILKGNRLFYRDGKNHMQIQDFKRTRDGVYYTIEELISNKGNTISDTKLIVFHLFSDTGEHYRIIKKINPSINVNNLSFTELNGNMKQGFHTIDSLYELHAALGGIYSESLFTNDTNNSFLLYSEASLQATANFITHIATAKDVEGERPLTQEGYYQPLKDAMIHQVAMNTAVKNGVGNINPRTSLYNNGSLRYMTIGTETYGIQLNSDHSADEAKMTEFSQVISALDASAKYHDLVSSVYNMLGQVTILLSLVEVDAVESITSENKSKLYEVIGRSLIKSFANKENRIGLGAYILKEISRTFNINADHALDAFKIPFSDSNIHSNILPTIIGTINSKSVKRQYPGLGVVIAGGKDMAMIYEINGKTYLYEDILRMALRDNTITSNITDISRKNRDIVRQYLEKEQAKIQREKSTDVFDVELNIIIYYTLNDEQKSIRVSLHDTDSYYKFKDRPTEFLFDTLVSRGEITTPIQKELTAANSVIYTINDASGNEITLNFNPSLEYQLDISQPRNLAPQKISFDIMQGNRRVHMNIFDTPLIRGRVNHNPNITDKMVDKMMKELENGRYYDGKNYYDIILGTYVNKPAEIIMSNLYKSRFDINDGDTLAKIVEDGSLYFTKKLGAPMSSLYALCYKRPLNKDLYITFSPVLISLKNSGRRKRWNINKVAVVDPAGRVRNKVYHMSDNNLRLFEVGREIVRKDIHYDESTDRFLDKDDKEAKGTFIKSGTEVLQYIEFVTKYIVRENGISREVYYINKECFNGNKDNPNNVMISRGELNVQSDMNNFVATLLANIYKSEDFQIMLLNPLLSDINYNALKGVLKPLSTKFATDSILSEFIYKPDISEHSLYSMFYNAKRKNISLLNTNKNKKNKENYKYSLGNNYRKLINAYCSKMRTEVYSSFLKSLNFTVSRIPAQDLQSFMWMLNVAYTGIDNAHCYVSHWQFWLLGNDVDIDKAYCLGLSFDSNGKYVGWSNLFNYNSLETLTASEELPYPTKKKYEVVSSNNTDGLLINDYVERLFNNALEKEQDILEANKQYNNDFTNFELRRKLREINSKYDSIEIREYARLISYLNNNKKNTKEVQDDVTNKSSYVTYLRIGKDNNSLKRKLTPEQLSQLEEYLKGTVLHNLKAHENTLFSAALIEEANKNYIASNILHVVGKLRNLTRAYTPLLMKETRSAASKSRKTQESNLYTLMNPLAKYHILYQALDGRNCVGIAANGLKASFIWHYFVNDIILNGQSNEIDRVKFNFESNRILGRRNGVENLESVTINILPDINLENVRKDKLNKLDLHYLNPSTDVGLIISEFISLATDNMKEMILPVINAGNKLMGVHILLATLGFNIEDTVAFMTSDVVSFIDAISDTNIFNNYQISVDDAINIAYGNLSRILKKFSKKTVSAIRNQLNNKKIKDIKIDDLLAKMDLAISIYSDDKSSYVYNELIQLNNILRFISNMRNKYNFDINNLDTQLDLKEFSEIYTKQKEFTLLGQILALNQGLPTDKSSLSALTLRLKTTYDNAIKLIKDSPGLDEDLRSLDVEKFIDDKDYQNRVIKKYNEFKKIVNIFDIITNVPLFSNILDLLSAEIKIDKNLSVRSKAFNKILDLRPNILMSEKYSRNVLEQISGLIISSFITKKMTTLNGKKFLLPYKLDKRNSISLLDSYALEYIAPQYGYIKINNSNDTGIFKHYFENVFIPMLKTGRYYATDPINGDIKEIYNKNIQKNYFVLSLLHQENRSSIFYKLNINMNTINDSVYGKEQLSNFQQGLSQLSNIYIDGMSIADLFALYNLIVNKNYYGNDRLTMVFSDLVKTGGENSVLKQYFRYVGEIDNKARIRVIDDPNEEVTLGLNEDIENVFDFYYLDALLGAANIVQSKWGQRDPFILLNNTQGELNIYQRDRYEYTQFGESIIPEIANETMDQKMGRLQIYRMYFVLSGPRMTKRNALLLSLYTVNEHTFDTILLLLKEGTIFMTKDNTNNLITIKVGNQPDNEVKFYLRPIEGAIKSNIVTKEDLALLFNNTKMCLLLAVKLNALFYSNADLKAELQSYINIDNIAANCSFEQLKEYFPTVNFEESDDVDILLINNLNTLKTNISGRVILSNGREIFVLRNSREDVKQFAKFISLRKKINAEVVKFDEGTTKMLNEIITKRNKLKNKKKVSSINELLLDFNYNNDNYNDMYAIDNLTKLKKHVRLILNDIIRSINNLIPTSHYYDDCLNLISNYKHLDIKNNNNVITIKELYNCIKTFYNESILLSLNIKSEKAFREFFSSSGKEFLTKWKTEVIDKVGDIFPAYTLTIDLENISESDTKKEGYKFLWELIKSKDADFDYEVQRVEEKNIILKREYLNIEEKYRIGYFTVNHFENVVPGGYKGYKIYKYVDSNNETYYLPSRFYKNSDMYTSRFKTLDEAKKYVDTNVLKQILSKYSYIDFYAYKTQGEIIKSKLFIPNNSMFDILDADINFDIGVEESEKSWLNHSLALVFKNIRKTWKLSDIVHERIKTDIENAEQMSVFLYKVTEYASLQGQKTLRTDEIITQALDYLDTIRNKERTTLFVEKNENYKDYNLNTYRVIEPKKGDMELYSLDIRGALPNTIVFSVISEALKPLGLDVELKTFLEIQLMIANDLANLAMVNPIKTKAFIYNNKIYINTTIALSTDMLHEYAHLLLGVLQKQNMNNYLLLLDIICDTNSGRKIYREKRDTYGDLGLSEIAIREEVFVDLYSLYLANNTTLNEETSLNAIFTAPDINTAFKSIFNVNIDATTVRSLANKSIDNVFKQFNLSVKLMLSEQENQQLNFKDALTYRKYSNWIAKLIRDGNIIEKC